MHRIYLCPDNSKVCNALHCEEYTSKSSLEMYFVEDSSDLFEVGSAECLAVRCMQIDTVHGSSILPICVNSALRLILTTKYSALSVSVCRLETLENAMNAMNAMKTIYKTIIMMAL